MRLLPRPTTTRSPRPASGPRPRGRGAPRAVTRKRTWVLGSVVKCMPSGRRSRSSRSSPIMSAVAGAGREAEARRECWQGAAELAGIGGEQRGEDGIGDAGPVGISDAGAGEDGLSRLLGDVLDGVLGRVGHRIGGRAPPRGGIGRRAREAPAAPGSTSLRRRAIVGRPGRATDAHFPPLVTALTLPHERNRGPLRSVCSAWRRASPPSAPGRVTASPRVTRGSSLRLVRDGLLPGPCPSKAEAWIARIGASPWRRARRRVGPPRLRLRGLRRRRYRERCWDVEPPEFDDGFYDCTRGTCPKGHPQTLDD